MIAERIEASLAAQSESEPFVLTSTTEDQTLASSWMIRQRERDKWNSVIDRDLVEWGRGPSQLADDDSLPPTRQLIQIAIGIAMEFRDRDLPGPLRVLPDREGGIVFESRDGNFFVSLRIQADLSIEVLLFRDCRLVLRRELCRPPSKA